MISLKLPLLKGDVTDNRSVHIKLISVLIISSPVGLQEAIYPGSLSAPSHSLSEGAQRGSTVSDTRASACSNFPAPVSLKTKLHRSVFFYRAPEEI